MRNSIIIFCFLLLPSSVFSQEKFYTLSNDTVFLNHKEKVSLVFYTNKSCFDCFFYINDFLKSDSIIHYYFIIEKTTSPMLNYDIYMKLANRGVDKKKILFTNRYSNEISPYLEVLYRNTVTKIPNIDIFEDKKTMILTKKVISLIKN